MHLFLKQQLIYSFCPFLFDYCIILQMGRLGTDDGIFLLPEIRKIKPKYTERLFSVLRPFHRERETGPV